MMPPHKPDDTFDEIVDMTPANSPVGDSDDSVGDSDEIEEMTPADTAGMYGPEQETEPVVTVGPGSPGALERTPAGRSGASSPLRMPTHTTEETGEAGEQRPSSGNKHLKTIILALLGIVALLYVGHKVLGSSLGSHTLGLIGGNNGSQSTSSQVPSVPTPKTVQIGNHNVTTGIGPLVLLNPGVVRQGTGVNVTGSGFDPGSVVSLSITRQGSAAALASKEVKVDKNGGFYGVSMTVPTSLSAGSFNVVAQQRNSSHTAQAFGSVAGGAPQVKFGPQVGQPGAVVTASLNGFAPMETINVYWNTLSGQPLTTFQADGGGGVGQGKLTVPYGAVGENTFLFVGAKSHSLVAANFLMLNLYPTVKLSNYAIKADNLISFSGKGFGPGEPVLVFLNSTEGQPLAVVSADSSGSFKNAPGFVIPYVLKGKQTLIFMGEQSRAPDTVSFTVLPYSPQVEPSTYGGLPGTAISFYVSNFAPSEVVHVYAGHTKSTLGTMVGCFQTDGKGKASNVGSYVIPGNAQGALGFALVGAKSGGVGTASVNVSAPPAPVQTPPQAPFTCPLDPPTRPSQSSSTPAGSSSHSPSGAALTAPQGSGGVLLSHRIAAQSSGGSPVSSMPSSTMDRHVGPLSLASIVEGAGLMWVIVVVSVTCTLIRRSYRLEIASPLYTRSRAPREQIRQEWEIVVSEGRQSPPIPGRRSTGVQQRRPSGAGQGDGANRGRQRTHGCFHSTVPSTVGGRTTVHASRSYWGAHIASRPISCRCVSWYRSASTGRSP